MWLEQAVAALDNTVASAGKKANIIFDKEHYLTLYYRHICEIFDESLRRKPFDSVIDYIDGYLEIELELFGLDIDNSMENNYTLRRRIKLGVPKDILGFFKYSGFLIDNLKNLLNLNIIKLHLQQQIMKLLILK